MLAPEVVYEYEGANTGYKGYRVDGDFSEYMQNRVGPWHRDDAGDQILLDTSGVEQDGFDSDTLRAHVSNEPWRVGESLAECFLVDYRGVSIPYNKIRDALNPRASGAGPDLVGITEDGLFVLGETKTSSDPSRPPGIVYSKSGMISQLIRIASDSLVRDSAIRWLGFGIRPKSVWRAALKKYVASNQKAFRVFGILVRDTTPDERDVRKVHDDVADALPKSAFLDILALYLLVKISDLPGIVEGAS